VLDAASIWARFLASIRDDLRAPLGADPALPALLAERIGAAQAAWPGLELPLDELVTFIAARLPDEPDPARGVRELQITDLYLACGCALGLPRAIAAFEAHYIPAIATAITALRADADLVDEVKQRVRHKLLVRGDDGPPRIVDYAGRGELRTWCRVIAVRIALTAQRDRKKDVALDEDELGELIPHTDDPDLALLKRRFRADFKLAFEQAVHRLAPRERTLLRQHLLDGLTIDDLGALYRVHRVTAARWLVKARASVWSTTRQLLTQRLALPASELEGLLRLARSQLHLSLERVLTRTALARRG
jgi:RNA polymerase sigma-70 factor, ECF subfamily